MKPPAYRKQRAKTVRSANSLVAARLHLEGTCRVIAVIAHDAKLDCGHWVARSKARVGRFTRCEVCRASFEESQRSPM